MQPPEFQIREHADAVVFAALAVPFLRRTEALNNLPLRILGDVLGGRATRERRLWSVHCGSDLVGIAVRTPPYNLVLSAPMAGIEALVEALRDEALPGVIGPTADARAFAHGWTQRHASVAQVSMKLRIYETNAALDWPSTEGAWRLAEASDLPKLVAWNEAFQLEADPSNPGREAPQSARGYFLWCDDAGEAVTMVYAGAASEEAAFITQVYTPRPHRRRGYATAAVGATTRHLLADGFRRCYLFTDLSNPVSNSIYPKVGYRPVGDYLNLTFAEVP